jgi:hypothetical protein
MRFSALYISTFKPISRTNQKTNWLERECLQRRGSQETLTWLSQGSFTNNLLNKTLEESKIW